MTQREVARQVGVSFEHLNRVLKGHPEPKVGLAIRIAKAYRIPTDEFWIDWAQKNAEVESQLDSGQN